MLKGISILFSGGPDSTLAALIALERAEKVHLLTFHHNKMGKIGKHRLVVDEILRNEGIDILHTHTLANRSLHTNETDAVLILDQLSYCTNTTITEVVDVIDRIPLTIGRVAKLQQVTNRFLDIVR